MINNTLVKKDVSFFESQVIPILLEMPTNIINVNLANVHCIDRDGINSLIKLSFITKKFNGSIFITNVNKQIQDYIIKSDLYEYCKKGWLN